MGVAVMENVSCAKMGAAVRKTTEEAIWSNMMIGLMMAGVVCTRVVMEMSKMQVEVGRPLTLGRKLKCK